MQKKDVQIGKVYLVNVSGKRARVRLTNESPYGGWEGLNIETGRKVRVKTAGRLQREIAAPAGPATEGQNEPETTDATELQASTETTPELEIETTEEPEAEPEPDAATMATQAAHTPPEVPAPDQEPDAATEATTGLDTAPEPTTPDQEPGTTTEATSAADRPLSKLTVEELRTLYREVIQRDTSSTSKAYLVWKLRQVKKGKIPTGPRRQRTAAAAAGPHKVLPLRLEENLVQQLDQARKRLGLASRMALFRSAIHAFLIEAGEVRVAEMFAPASEA